MSPELQAPAPCAEPQVDRENPWPGLLPFTEDMRAFFHGREAEARDLLGSINRSTLTILYGKSGLGKTSLLRASIFPSLRAQECLPIYLKPDYTARATTPLEYLRSRLAAELKAAGIDTPPPSPEEGLWEYFHGAGREFWRNGFEPVKLVLVFDQFEEIFTVGRATDAARSAGDEFLAELGALIEDVAPLATRHRLERQPGIAEDLEAAATSYKVVLSLREDYLYWLEDVAKSYPAFRHHRLALRPLTGLKARDIVLKAGGEHVQPEVVPQIVCLVAGQEALLTQQPKLRDLERALSRIEVDPSLLSLFCRELNGERLARAEATGQAEKIDARIVSADKGREILSTFYERCWANLPEEARAFLEDNLVTSDGFRDSIAHVKAVEHQGISTEVIDCLIDRRLLRCEEDEHLGPRRLELTHDVLTGPVLASRRAREERREQEARVEAAQRTADRARREQAEAEERERRRKAQLDTQRRYTRLATIFGIIATLVAIAALYLWKQVEDREAKLNLTRKDRDETYSALVARNADLRRTTEALKQSTAEANEKRAESEKQAALLAEQKRQLSETADKLKAQAEILRAAEAKAVKYSADLEQEKKKLETQAEALKTAKQGAEKALSESREAQRAMAIAGGRMVDLVLEEEIGLPAKGARELLDAAQPLFGDAPIDDPKQLPEVIRGRSQWILARGRVYAYGPASELGGDRFKVALGAADAGRAASQHLAETEPENVLARDLELRSLNLRGEILYHEAEKVIGPEAYPLPEGYKNVLDLLEDARNAFQASFDLLVEDRAALLGQPSLPVPGSLEVIRAFHHLGDVHRRLAEDEEGDNRTARTHQKEAFSQAEEFYRDALKLAEKLSPGPAEEQRAAKDVLAESHNKIGNIFLSQAAVLGDGKHVPANVTGEYKTAAKLEREVVASLKTASDPSAARELPGYQRHLAKILGNLAQVLIRAGERDHAGALLKERIEIDRRLFESNPGNHFWREFLAEGYRNLAQALYDKKLPAKPGEALEMARLAVFFSQERNPDHLKLYHDALLAAHDTAEAKRIQGIYDELVGNDPPAAKRR